MSLSEKYVKLDVLTAFIETFCRSVPQEQVSQDWHESSLQLLPTNSFSLCITESFLHHALSMVFYASQR